MSRRYSRAFAHPRPWNEAMPPRIEVVARGSDCGSLAVNVYIESVDLGMARLADKGKTQTRYGGWWRSRQLKKGDYIVIVDFVASGKCYGDSRAVTLENNDVTICFGPNWNHVKPYQPRTRALDIVKARSISRARAREDGTKIYTPSRVGGQDVWTLPSGEIRCRNCGVVSGSDARFCSHCGNRIQE